MSAEYLSRYDDWKTTEPDLDPEFWPEPVTPRPPPHVYMRGLAYRRGLRVVRAVPLPTPAPVTFTDADCPF